VCYFIVALHCKRVARAKMSLLSYNPPTQLTDDVLLVIFDQLDEDDFLRCEVVCRRWRNFLLSHTPWRRLFHRKIVSSEKWRQLWRSFGVDETKVPSGHYRGLCKSLIHELNETDRNWRNGNFTTTFNNYNASTYSHVTIGNDCIACRYYSIYMIFNHEKTFEFFDQCSPEVKSRVRIPHGSSAVTNTEIVVVWDKKILKILDTDGQLIRELQELDEDERVSWNLKSCCLSGDRLAVISHTNGEEKLSLWDVRNPPNAICLKSRRFNLNLELKDYPPMKMKMKVDDKFVVVSISQGEPAIIYFFLKETLDLHWQKPVDWGDFAYGKGLLLLFFLRKKSRKSRTNEFIEIIDVTSGHCIRELPFTVGELSPFVCFNSKFMIVAPFKCVPKKKLYVYDLEAIKDPKSDGLIRTLVVANDFHSTMVNESEIFCINDEGIISLNFSRVGLFGNAARSLTLSLPWRDVWRSKGVDEEPLEPVRHMEVYMEVLKYFHQLSANCQAAIEIYPDSDLMADNMAFYIEYMNSRSEEQYSTTAHISKTAKVTVFGKTFQLIDTATGRVVKEMTLTRDAISLHFGHNLLVFVFQNTNTEHVLSIWRVDNSLNLTHLKDATIGNYDGSLQVDEQFIAVKTGKQAWTFSENTYNFISMNTFQIERSLSSRAIFLKYHGGYLFVQWSSNLVRTWFSAHIRFSTHFRVAQIPAPRVYARQSSYKD
jgi:F-box-like